MCVVIGQCACELLQLNWGYAVVQLVDALRYKLEDRGFDS